MAGDEPVTSPDQHRPTVSARWARLGAIVIAVILVGMSFGNHEGGIENIYLFGSAGLLILILILDFVLRRNGLKSD